MSATDDLIKQILASSNTSKWSGEGFGSAEKNAADMAKILNSIGITDIHQFGKVPQYQQAEVQYGVNGKIAQADEDGNYYIMVPGAPDDEGNPTQVRKNVSKQDLKPIYGFTDPDYGGFIPADQSKVKIIDGKPVVDTGQTTYGNIKTGQAVPNTYSERQQGNFFGGTFAGKGNTGYGVQFDAQGNPHFYTQGATSNDLAILMQDLGPVAQIGLAIATGGLSIPEQIAARFAINVLSGQDIGDAVKGAAVSYAMAQIPGTDVMKDASKFLNGIDDTGVLSSAFKNASMSGAGALLTGQDVGKAMLAGATTGGVNGALNALMDTSDFKELTKDLSAAQKKMVINAATGVMTGKPLDQIIINSAMSAAKDAAMKAQTENQVLDPYFKSMGSKVAGAEDTITLPNGIQLAGINNGIFSDAGNGVFKTDVGGTPLFAESKGADSLKVPFGTRLMSSTEETSEVDPDTGKTVFKKPENAYYDPTLNAWLVKEDASQMFNTTSFANDMALFNSSQGDLKDVASKTASTSDDYLADLLNSIGIKSTTDLSSKNLSNQDILDMIGYKGDGVDTLTVSDRKVTDDAGTVDVAGKKVTPVGGTDELVMTAKRPGLDEVTTDIDKIKANDLTLDKIVADTTKPDTKTTPTKVTPTKVTTPITAATPVAKPDTPYVPTGQAPPPSQDPYAHVKFMEDLFGPQLSNQFLTDVSMQTPKSNDIEALLRVLRG